MKINYSITLYVFAVILFAGIISCKLGKKDNDWVKNKLKGRIKSVTEFSFSAVERFGNIEKGVRIQRTSEPDQRLVFNKDGLILESDYYNSDRSLSTKVIYEYDNKGNNVESIHYNSNGSLSTKVINKYDNKGNKVESNHYNSNGSLSTKVINKYDNKGNKVESNHYNSDGSLNFMVIFKYDKRGNCVESNHFNSDGILGTKVINKYDNNGNIVEVSNYGSNEFLWLHKFFTYDDKGNLIEEINDFLHGVIDNEYTYNYEMDKRGNWIKQIRFADGFPRHIIEREIEYF